ncbi:MAG: hypothetical protein JNJ69_01680 [Leptospiraceae bacterium]|nr:hypothetical protein [Leptospiraceae bacterium]
MNTAIPYEKPFADFLRYVYETYPKSAFPESYVPIIAHKATAGYAVEKYFPELLPEFVKCHGDFVYAISEPGWKNSPLNIQSELKKLPDGSFELYANKSFILDADVGVFVVRHEKEFALVIVDTDNYRTTRVALDMPEATYLVGDGHYITHYRAEFTIPLSIVPYRPISKRDILLLSRNIVFREQVAYAVLAAAEASKSSDTTALQSRVDLLFKRAKEEPGQDDIAVAREILSAAIVRIVAKPDAHGFWKWLAKFVKPA